MKLFVALGLLAVAVASSTWRDSRPAIHEKAFREGKQYIYNFDGQIATGLAVPSSQHAATRVQSSITVAFEKKNIVVMKMDKIRVGFAHRDLVEPRNVQPFGLFEETPLTKEQKDMLSLPVRFRFEQGLVEDIEFDREEQAWSANIKRAVLNMLNINMAQKGVIEPVEIESKEENKNFWSTKERTLEGECETEYTVVPEGEEKMRVSKSINFDKCAKRVDIRYGYRFDEECPSCEKKFLGDEKNSESATVIEYGLRGNNKAFLITEVELRSHYVYTPMAKEQAFTSTLVNNQLVLVKVEEAKRISGPKTEKKETLIYSSEWEETIEKFAMTGEEELIRNSPFPWMTKKVHIAREALRSMLHVIPEQNEDVLSPEINEIIHKIVRVIRLSTKEEIKEIAKEIESGKSVKDEKRREIFFDALAIAGTKNTVDFLVEKIVEKEISPLKAARLMKELVSMRSPSEKIIDSIVSLCREDISTRNPVLRQSCWLTTGALMNGLCGDQKEDRPAWEVSGQKKNAVVCPFHLKKNFVSLMVEQMHKAETRYEKILALKTMANSGIDLIVFPLERFIKNAREERSVRLQAIEALRKLRSVLPRKIHSVLLPIFKNTKEVPEIRAAAFTQIMHTIPHRVVIDMITSHLIDEPNHQIYSYAITYLNSLAKSEIPCEKKMAEDIKNSLSLVPFQSRKALDSHHIRASLFNEEYYNGASLNWAMLFTNDSVLPKEVMASIDSMIAGEWTKYIGQIGVSQQNVDHFLYKMLEMSEDGVVTRGERSALKPLKQLMEKMNIKSRRFSTKDAQAMIYLRYRDLDYAFLPIDEQTLPEMVKEIVRENGINFNKIDSLLKKGLNFKFTMATFDFERTRTIPTTLGLPLEISGKMPTFLTAEGAISGEINTLSGVKVNVQAEPKIATSYIHQQMVYSPVHAHGVKIVSSALAILPIDFEAEINWKKNFDIRTTVRVPELKKEKRVLSIATRPVTFVRYYNNDRTSVIDSEKTAIVPDFPSHEVERVYGDKVTGIRFNVRGSIHRHLLAKMEKGQTLPLFVSDNLVEMFMEKTESTPKEVVLFFAVDNFDTKKTISERPDFEGFYKSDVNEHFEVESSEYFKEDEEERRGEFEKYVKNYPKNSKTGYSARVQMKIETTGSSVERKGAMAIRVNCEDSMTFCDWLVEAERTPLLRGERKQWKATVTAQTLFPESILSIKQLKEQKHRELNAKINAKWGEEMENSFKIRVQGEQTKEQKKWQRLVEKNGEVEESMELLVRAARLNQIKIVADYNIAPETQVEVGRISSLIRGYYPISASVEPRLTRKSFEREARILATLSVEPKTWQFMNFTMESPSERMTIRDIALPIRPRWFSIHHSSSKGIRSIRSATSSMDSAMCTVSSRKVNTFDEVIFRAPLTTCYSVLAKDCSEEPKFVVMMKKVEKNEEEKKMKIIADESVIEVEGEKLVIRINGEEPTEKDMEKVGLQKKGDVVIFNNDDIFVRFDGLKAEIKINELFKNKQCGLCGHYDGETEGEFRRADDEETDDLESFHRSFFSRESECEIEESKVADKKNYKKWARFEEVLEEEIFDKDSYDFEPVMSWKRVSSSDEESFAVEPVERTRVVEYSDRVCFTKEPVPECPRRSHESARKEIKAKFACLERSAPEARRLIREARNEVIEISHPVSYTETLTVPKECVVY